MALDYPILAEAKETPFDDGVADALTAGEFRDGKVVQKAAAAVMSTERRACERAIQECDCAQAGIAPKEGRERFGGIRGVELDPICGGPEFDDGYEVRRPEFSEIK
jgi:hypothetical protein